MQRDYGLDTLLSLHQEILAQEGGYWAKIEAYQVEPSEHIPHGIKYSLTLHDRRGTRVLGYDNAHLVKPAKFKYAGQVLPYDHRSEEHTSELQSLMRISYAVFCLKKKKEKHNNAI